MSRVAAVAAGAAGAAAGARPRGGAELRDVGALILIVRDDTPDNKAATRDVLLDIERMVPRLRAAGMRVRPELVTRRHIEHAAFRALLKRRQVTALPALVGCGATRVGRAQIVGALQEALDGVQRERAAVRARAPDAAAAPPPPPADDAADPVGAFYAQEMTLARAREEGTEDDSGFEDLGAPGGGSGAVQKQVAAVERKRAKSLRRFRNAPPEEAEDEDAGAGDTLNAGMRAFQERRGDRAPADAPRDNNLRPRGAPAEPEDDDISRLLSKLAVSGDAVMPDGEDDGDGDGAGQDAVMQRAFWGNKVASDD